MPATVLAYLGLDARLGRHPTRSLELSLVGSNLRHGQLAEYVIASLNPREAIEPSAHGKVVWRY